MKGEFDMTDILKDPKVVRETTEAQIAVHWGEEELYYPPASFISQANLSDPDVNKRFSEANFPDCFQEYAEMLTWDERWHTTLDTNDPPFWKWFVGENSAGGAGITVNTAPEIFNAGVDIMTTGDH